MSYEELVESRKNIGDMTKEELFTYCGGLLSEVWDYEKENEQLHNKVEELMELYTTERHCKDDYKAIINEALGIVNERVNYYHHTNKKEILEDWENIFNALLRRDNE